MGTYTWSRPLSWLQLDLILHHPPSTPSPPSLTHTNWKSPSNRKWPPRCPRCSCKTPPPPQPYHHLIPSSHPIISHCQHNTAPVSLVSPAIHHDDDPWNSIPWSTISSPSSHGPKDTLAAMPFTSCTTPTPSTSTPSPCAMKTASSPSGPCFPTTR